MPFLISVVNPPKRNKGNIEQTIYIRNILWPSTQNKAKRPKPKNTKQMSHLGDEGFVFFSPLGNLIRMLGQDLLRLLLRLDHFLGSILELLLHSDE